MARRTDVKPLKIGAMEWVVAEDAGAAWDVWLQARDNWLEAKFRKSASKKTRRAYAYAWWDFFQRFLLERPRPERRPGRRRTWHLWPAGEGAVLAAAGRRSPGQISGEDVMAWQADLEEAALSNATINQRLSALSSFYEFCELRCQMIDDNPVRYVERAPVDAWESGTALDAGQVAALLRVIPRSTAQGLRDYAMMAAYVFLGRRSSELARLRWGDVFESRDRLWYRWKGKNKRSWQTNEMPGFIWDAICTYLSAAGRLDEAGAMDDREYVFTALRDNAKRLPNVRAALREDDLAPSQYEPTAQPLDGSTIYRLVQKYCRKAGLPEIRTHDLRHTAACLRDGDTIEEIAHLLGHSNWNTTRRYKQHWELRPDPSADRVRALIQEKMKGTGEQK